jgi:hypothetical protein
MRKAQLRPGDLVRVIMTNGMLGETLYRLVSVGERGHCTIREFGNERNAVQRFDTSLLGKDPGKPRP